MNRPATVTVPITDELWERLSTYFSVEDEDDIVDILTDGALALRQSWDYDSPRD